MKYLLCALLMALSAHALAGEKVEVKIGKPDSQTIAFEDKVVDGKESFYLEFSTLQKKKIFRAITKKEFEDITSEYAKIREIFKKIGVAMDPETCKQPAEITSYSIPQVICLDKLNKKQLTQFNAWFKRASDVASAAHKK
ncbi:MAG: hypothetical protein H7326_10705 [Bdellovibrionaceae bacterium]|nr:hypothetical protein [Pseudobdellovibrionaceae bacterium]